MKYAIALIAVLIVFGCNKSRVAVCDECPEPVVCEIPSSQAMCSDFVFSTCDKAVECMDNSDFLIPCRERGLPVCASFVILPEDVAKLNECQSALVAHDCAELLSGNLPKACIELLSRPVDAGVQ